MDAQEPDEPPEESLNYAVLRNGDVSVHLGLATEMRRDAGQGGAALFVDDFDETYRRAQDAGATVYLELGRIPAGAGGNRTFGILDPDGNQLAFVEATAGS